MSDLRITAMEEEMRQVRAELASFEEKMSLALAVVNDRITQLVGVGTVVTAKEDAKVSDVIADISRK